MSSNAPKRGKFLSQPQPSRKESASKPPSSNKPATPRGKTLGKSLPTSSASSLTGSGADADVDASLSNLKTIVTKAKEAASARRKEVATKRDNVFNDLDQAENIIVSLLDCASHVALSLSDMTTANANGDNSFEELANSIKENGLGYLAGVKKVHSLLAPHASLVKSYHNQDEAEKGDGDTKNEKKEATISDEIINWATSNMYAARVEKRLALERSEILKEMIRLEDLESTSAATNNTTDADEESAAASSKRKHEAVE